MLYIWHGVGDGRHVPYGSSPGTASRMVVACGMARRRIACRHVAVRVDNLDVPAMFTIRRTERPS